MAGPEQPLPEEGSLPEAPDPGGVAKANIVERERKTNMYFSAVGFIYDVKRGPFWEHSPMLFDISGVRAGWAKINKVWLVLDIDVIRTDRNRACSKCTTLKSSRSSPSCSTSPLARYSVSTVILMQFPRFNSLNHNPRNDQDLPKSQGLRQGPGCPREQLHHGPHQPGVLQHPSQIRRGYLQGPWRLHGLRARVQMTLHPPRLPGQSRY